MPRMTANYELQDGEDEDEFLEQLQSLGLTEIELDLAD